MDPEKGRVGRASRSDQKAYRYDVETGPGEVAMVGQARCKCSLSGPARSPDVSDEQGISEVTSMNWCDGLDLHVVVRMNLAVANLAAYVLDERLDMLVHIPPIHAGKGRSAESFQALG